MSLVAKKHLCQHWCCTEPPIRALLAGQGLFHRWPQGKDADHSTACCEYFAWRFVEKVTEILSDLEAVIDAGTVDITLAPAFILRMDRFQCVLYENGSRIFGEVKATTYSI